MDTAIARTTLLATILTAAVGTSLALARPADAEVFIGARPTLASREVDGSIVETTAYSAVLSGDARFVAFVSTDPDVAPGDANGANTDVFVRDRWAGTTDRVSVSSSEQGGNQISGQPSISDDGRYVAFLSSATNLAPGGGSESQVYLRDRYAGTTTRVTKGWNGAAVDGVSSAPVISGDGSTIAFTSVGTNLVKGDTNQTWDVFAWARTSGTTERVSVTTAEAQGGNGLASMEPSISDDGQRIAFRSKADLSGGQAGSNDDVFVRDRTEGSTVLGASSSNGTLPNAPAGWPVLSGNGRYLLFASTANNLVTGDSNTKSDVFRKDLQGGSTARVSLTDGDLQLNDHSSPDAISDDGNRILFSTKAVAGVGPDAGYDLDVFIRTYANATTVRQSSTTGLADPALDAEGTSLSDDGESAAFDTSAAFVADHTTGKQVYVRGPLSQGPFVTAASLVDRQYQDFLGRPPTTQERATWEAGFISGAKHPAQLISELAMSDEFAAKRAPVVRLYWAFFLRMPDPSGMAYWIGKYQNGASLSSIAQKFAQSSEFKTKYGSVANQQYVTLVYKNVFERNPDADGLAYWTKKLDQKQISRGQVLVNFSESSEGKRFLAPQVHLALIPIGMLGALPTGSWFAEHLAPYKQWEKAAAGVAQSVLRSTVYDAKVN